MSNQQQQQQQQQNQDQYQQEQEEEEEEEEQYIAACENIHKTYLLGIEGVPALRGVSFDIVKCDFLLLYGTSGSGKSSILNILGTIDKTSKGSVELFDRRITERTPDEYMALLRCKKIGFIFQSFNLLSTMNAMDNVSLPMIIAGELSSEQIKDRAKSLLVKVGLGHRLDHFPSQLSGGENQRVSIARSLANEPQLLLCDEPTGDLARGDTKLIMDILLDLNINQKLTIVMVTHDVYMKKFATRIVHMRDGRLSREEIVDKQIRADALMELKADVAEIKLKLQMKKDAGGGGFGGGGQQQQREEGDVIAFPGTTGG